MKLEGSKPGNLNVQRNMWSRAAFWHRNCRGQNKQGPVAGMQDADHSVGCGAPQPIAGQEALQRISQEMKLRVQAGITTLPPVWSSPELLGRGRWPPGTLG